MEAQIKYTTAILWFIWNIYLVIQMTKIYFHLYFIFEHRVPDTELQEPFEFPEQQEQWEHFFVRIFALLSSVSEITSEPRSWNTCLVIHNKPFPLLLGSLISDFQKTPKTGDSLPRQLSKNRGLELSGPPLEMVWGLNPSLMVSDFMNHACEMKLP